MPSIVLGRHVERFQAEKKEVKDLVRMATSAQRRYRPLWNKVKTRRLHFYNDDSVGPGQGAVGLGSMPEPLSHINFQTDIIRDTWVELKARLTENHWVAGIDPVKEMETANLKAEELAETINALGQIIEGRLGYTLQGGMADGQIIDAYAVLHWRRMDQFYPEVPEYVYLDELPEDEDERKKYNSEPEEEGENAGKYRETADSVEERSKVARARAGSPYMLEILPMEDVAFVDDVVSTEAAAIHTRTIGLLEYGDELAENDKIIICANETEMGKGLGIYAEQDAPKTWEESRGEWDWNSTVSIMTIWTRDSWYELASNDAILSDDAMTADTADWQLVKSGRHAFGRVPFMRIHADIFTSSRDPVHRYLPACEGLYRRKPFYDRDMAITKGIAEWGLPRLMLVNPRGAEQLKEDGTEVANMGEDTGMADVLPTGYDIRTVVAEVTTSQMTMLQMEWEALQSAAPATGVVDIESKEQPWTARSRIQQANVTPLTFMDAQRRGLTEAWRSILHDIATPAEDYGLGGPVWAFKRGEDGREDRDTIIGVQPEDIETLKVNIEIKAVSNAERITLIEHGLVLWQNGIITLRQFFEEYFVVPDPLDRAADVTAERVFKTQIEQGRIAFWVAKNFGSKYAVGVDGQLVGFGGQAVNPEATAMARGVTPVNPMGEGSRSGNARQIPPLVDNVSPTDALRETAVRY